MSEIDFVEWATTLIWILVKIVLIILPLVLAVAYATYAERKLSDNVELEIKKNRLSEVIELQHNHSLESNKKALGNTYKVLIEKVSKKSVEKLCGRNSQNSMIVFDKGNNKIGDYVDVVVEDCTSATLIGRVIKSNQQLKK